MNKYLKIGLIILGILAIAGGYYFPKYEQRAGATTSTVGATNTTARIASIAMAPLTPAATSSSILNTDSTDRNVSSVEAQCSSLGTSVVPLTGNTGGLTIQGLVLQVGTTSSSGQNLPASIYSSTTIATSTTYGYISTSTEGVIFAVSRIWPTNTYLTFAFNATNTAACTVVAKYSSL